MEKISRSNAKAHGLTRYFTGKPCKHGHVSERMVSSGACVTCKHARTATWRSENPEKAYARSLDWRKRNAEKRQASQARYLAKYPGRHAEQTRQWAIKNPEKIRAKNARWLAENQGRMRELNAIWYLGNKDKVIAKNMRRRSSLSAATPVWDQDLTSLVVSEAADLAARRESVTGCKWHIDHMIPIKCRKASGLHVWSNLQVIPAKLNAKKHNQLWLTEPGEWIAHT